MHRQVAEMYGLDTSQEIDHLDGNGLNNVISNLRPATRTQQQRNRGLRIDASIPFEGVHWHKPLGCYCAQISVNGRKLHFGYFSKAEDAARAYDRAAIIHHGEFARLNFPHLIDEYLMEIAATTVTGEGAA